MKVAEEINKGATLKGLSAGSQRNQRGRKTEMRKSVVLSVALLVSGVITAVAQVFVTTLRKTRIFQNTRRTSGLTLRVWITLIR